MSSFDPSKGFIQFGEGRKQEAEAHLRSIFQYNANSAKKRRASEDDSYKTPSNKVPKEKAVFHPTDVAPNALNWRNLHNKHLGCFIRKVAPHDLPLRKLKPGVLTAMHHVSSSLPIALSNVFPNHSTETHRKLFVQTLHYAALAMSKGSLKLQQTDYFDPIRDETEGDGPAAESPESAASVRALTEDSSDQAGTRASELCFQTRAVALDEWLATFLCEEKADKNLFACVPQWVGYAAPKLVELVRAWSAGVRWLDLAGCITSTKEWMGLQARPLAWLHLTPGGPTLKPLADDVGLDRFAEAQGHLEEIRTRWARVHEEFPTVIYEGPFLVLEVLYTEERPLLTFPLEQLSLNNGTLDYLQLFLSSCFRSRVEEWTPEIVYELYGAAWASQHLRSALLTYASVEKTRELAGKELTPDVIREHVPEHVLQLDPLRCYRDVAAPLKTPIAVEPRSAEAPGAMAPEAGSSNVGPWWESATIKGFAEGMKAAGWLEVDGKDAASRLRLRASQLILGAMIEGKPDSPPTSDDELALQVLDAAKILIKKKETDRARELLSLLVALA